MKKLVITIFLSLFLLTSCFGEKDAVILLSSEPIEPGNFEFVNKTPVFTVMEKIYYILLTKEPIESEKLRIQVLKIDRKYPAFKVEPAYCIDINRGPEEHYVMGHFVIHKDGDFFIRIFSHDNFELPITQTEFFVNKR